MVGRREWLKILVAAGVGTPAFHRAAAALAAQEDQLDAEKLKTAAWITDFELSDDDSEQILNRVKRNAAGLKQLRNVSLDHSLSPAFQFKPLTKQLPSKAVNRAIKLPPGSGKLPDSDDEIAFCSIQELGHYLTTGQISSVKLTEIYLQRLKKYGPMLRCVVNLTEELAIQQAKRADAELAAGTRRGPLHGIPWGAKDLIDVPGYPTTWGIPVYEKRIPDTPATVYRRLEEAGAVLVAKLSLGAIALGDKWFGGTTRNPWNPEKGSSGSSAGSASATTAGLVGFSIGSETLGSITTPSKICGTTGFRPTFGRVSRFGCMPLSWTMDKVGPICRSAADCAVVFAAIHGADGKDVTAENYDFNWPQTVAWKGLKVGYAPGKAIEERPELATLQEFGCELIEVRLPSSFPIFPLTSLIDIEAASVFDVLLREGKTEGWNSWPAAFKSAQFVSAIDYLRLMRLRTRLMSEMEEFMSQVDVLVNVRDVFHTNFTGHPSIVFPRSFADLDSGGKRPVMVTVTGHLNRDARLLAVANQLQSKIGDSSKPDLDPWLEKFDAGELPDL